VIASFRFPPLFPNNLEYLVSTEVAARMLGREVGFCSRPWTAEHSTETA